ncbi:MAG: Rha family transcriptional regulator [Janthinobacterium lividum]
MTDLPFSLVVAVDGEPRAASDLIAKGVKQQHASVLKLVRKHQASLERFGRIRFEIQFGSGRQTGGKPTEIAHLNEPQATLLVAMMRNTEIVIDCKVRLVDEFFRMRDALARRDKNLWQQMQALIVKEVNSQVRASFGSHLMLVRKREIPPLRDERLMLEQAIQPSLLN